VADVKERVLKLAALTDRGQRTNALVAETFQEEKVEMRRLCEQLAASASASALPPPEARESVAGAWDLVYSDVEVFRSSPFFLAVEAALNDKAKSDLFFKLHLLQTCSWGASTVGRVSQRIDFERGELESEFDTTLFGLTVLPVIGWFKLLPTFGGRVVTLATGLEFVAAGEGGNPRGDAPELRMVLERTRVVDAPGVKRIPLVAGLLMERWAPVRGVWKLLPWNGGPLEGRDPACSVWVTYVDGDMRIAQDMHGALFVYVRPVLLGA